jgi:DNA repair exonuclease SbcCD ATPase subunit
MKRTSSGSGVDKKERSSTPTASPVKPAASVSYLEARREALRNLQAKKQTVDVPVASVNVDSVETPVASVDAEPAKEEEAVNEVETTMDDLPQNDDPPPEDVDVSPPEDVPSVRVELDAANKRIAQLETELEAMKRATARSAPLPNTTAQKQLDDTMRKLADKEKQIFDLLNEGEKLSKQELKLNQLIKKLRVANNDSEKAVTELAGKLNAVNMEKSDLQAKLAKAQEAERKATGTRILCNGMGVDALRSSTRITDLSAKQISKMEADLNASQERVSKLETMLALAQSELHMQKENNTVASNVQELLDRQAHLLSDSDI